MQQAIFMSNPSMAAGNIASAQADAMRTAAGNENGAMMGFMGMEWRRSDKWIECRQSVSRWDSNNSRLRPLHSRLRPLHTSSASTAATAGSGRRGSSCTISSRKLDLQVRDNGHRQILSGMRQPLSRQKHRDGPAAAVQ